MLTMRRATQIKSKRAWRSPSAFHYSITIGQLELVAHSYIVLDKWAVEFVSWMSLGVAHQH